MINYLPQSQNSQKRPKNTKNHPVFYLTGIFNTTTGNNFAKNREFQKKYSINVLLAKLIPEPGRADNCFLAEPWSRQRIRQQYFVGKGTFDGLAAWRNNIECRCNAQ